MTDTNRRNFLFASSGAAAGSLLVPGLLEAQEKSETTQNAFATSGFVTGQLKPLKHTEIPGFLSATPVNRNVLVNNPGGIRCPEATLSRKATGW